MILSSVCVLVQNAAGPQSSQHWAAAGAPQPTLYELYKTPVSISGFVMVRNCAWVSGNSSSDRCMFSCHQVAATAAQHTIQVL